MFTSTRIPYLQVVLILSCAKKRYIVKTNFLVKVIVF